MGLMKFLFGWKEEEQEKVYCGECKFFYMYIECDSPNNVYVEDTYRERNHKYFRVRYADEINKYNLCKWFEAK